jgi:hypothetical protein
VSDLRLTDLLEHMQQAAAHARRQLAAQGLKLPTQSWKTGKISNPVI